MNIKYFTSNIPGDKNHKNEHALINDHIEFCKFPYQSYKARYNNISCVVSQNMGIWYASSWECLQDGSGKSNPLNSAQFDNKDDAFTWAYYQMVGIYKEHNTINEMKKYLSFMGYYSTDQKTIGQIYQNKNFGLWNINKAGKYFTLIISEGI
jgi:hypothetical protein